MRWIISITQIIFETALNDGVFPEDCKKVNIVPTHKNDLKTVLINYLPISLLSMFAKIIEKIIFTSTLEYFIENELFIVCQSGIFPSDSCTWELLSIINEMQKSFDESPRIDIRGIFPDISKAFGKVWYKGFVYKHNRMKFLVIFLNLLKIT